MRIDRSLIIERLIQLPRFHKKLLVLSLDSILCLITSWFAFCLRFDDIASIAAPVVMAGVFSVTIALPIFIKMGLYRAIFRFSGWYATLSLVKAISLYAFIYLVLLLIIGVEGVPRSIGIIQPVLLFIGIGLSRLMAKYFLNRFVGRQAFGKSRCIALIYGAGSSGRQIVSGLRQGHEIKPVGFIDDDCRLWKSIINGLPVYAPKDVPNLIQSNRGITDILLAMPLTSRSRRKEILTGLSNLPVHVRTLPSLNHLADGSVKIEDIREVEVEDVLGREPVKANQDLLRQNIADKVVMVTGAGGSIGSELCRQILKQQPKNLVLFELSEFALYAIERELVLLGTPVKITPILGSVLNENKLKRVLQSFGVQTLFHAAAYKHVPMIEMNPAAGVCNNVFGTLSAVEAAIQCELETFVLISTDKAVRPTNVMGCSKRLAELVLQAKDLQSKRFGGLSTKLTMVRFGNVLGSSGSVLPVFREQIKEGGPVTVTHPEIIRYFMTIPEAAQLVIQAGALGEGGDVMVLNMGEPVKILDLAKRMIHLSGFSHKDENSPNGDIEIKFTGLRPGEKLYEELLIGNNTSTTKHPLIMQAKEHALSWEELEPLLIMLKEVLELENSDAIRELLKKIVPEFEHRENSNV